MNRRPADPSTDFERALRALADDEGWGGETWDPRRGEHPPGEELCAYGEGTLDGARRARLQEHLTTCAECADLVADQAVFPALPGGDDEPGEFEIAAAWRDFRNRLAAEGVAPAARTAAGRRSPFWQRAAAAWAVAATLLVACLVLGGWNLQLGERIATLTAPQPNVPLADLMPADQRSDQEQEVVQVDPRGEFYVLIAYPSSPAGYRHDDGFSHYRWHIVDADGRDLLSGGGLERQSLGEVTLRLHRDSLPPGEYRLSLTGVTGDGEMEPAGNQPFRITGE